MNKRTSWHLYHVYETVYDDDDYDDNDDDGDDWHQLVFYIKCVQHFLIYMSRFNFLRGGRTCTM